jgi:hypothetical protein
MQRQISEWRIELPITGETGTGSNNGGKKRNIKKII